MAETCTIRAPTALAAFATAPAPAALHRIEGLRADLGENADQVDGDVGVAHRGSTDAG